jgi:hypothetical protein
MTNPELRAFALSFRGKPGISEPMLALAEAYLRDHAADEDEPIDADYLRGLKIGRIERDDRCALHFGLSGGVRLCWDQQTMSGWKCCLQMGNGYIHEATTRGRLNQLLRMVGYA